MGTRNKKKINVERVGNSGHPITTNPTPVRHVMFQDKIPYTTFSNGTVVQSTVNKDGVNEQILRKSNLNPAYKLEVKYDGVSTPDTLGLYRANHPSDLWAYDKIKPGTKEYKEAVEKFNSYGIPLATYGEAYDNLEEVERQVDGLQEGGEIPSNDQQQQLFVAIITDMAKTLGVEPSQELAEAVMAAFENNDDSQGLLTLFTKTKDKFMNETGLFREGGKMIAFIEKFGCGGKSPKKKTSKKQEGGEVENSGAGYITTPVNDIKARREWRQRTGGSRADARRTQRILAANIENKGGISRGSARNSAAAIMMDPQRFAAPSERPALDPANQTQLNVASPALNPVQALGPSRPAPAVSTPASTPMGPIDRIQGRVNNAIDGYQRGTDRIIDGIQAGGNRVYDAIQDGARRIGDGIQTGGNAIVDGMQGVSRRAGDWVQNAGNKVFDGIQSASNVFGIRPEFVDRAIDDVQAGVNRAYDNAQDFGARVVDGIQSGANRAYDAVQDGARRIGDGVQNVGNRIIDGGQRVRNAVIDGTQNFGNRVVDGVQAGAQRLGQGIQRAGQRISEWFR